MTSFYFWCLRSLTVNLYEDAHAVADSVLHNKNSKINYLKLFNLATKYIEFNLKFKINIKITESKLILLK